MLENIIKFQQSTGEYKYSILIPTWNNLSYIQNCLNSIQKHSTFDHQIIVFVNEGKDGTTEWIKKQKNIDYILSDKNVGVCYALNLCRSLVKTDYILYANDDMYFLPEWDLELDREVNQIPHNKFMISSTAIEPTQVSNSCVIEADYGNNLETFQEERLLAEFKSFTKDDWTGTTWPPSLTHIDTWDLVGGMSTEFSPGMYSDPDLVMKLWLAGVRYFKGVGLSRVYHFGSKSTGRVKKNPGRKTFVNKWGISANTFVNKYLQRGAKFTGELPPPRLSLLTKIKSRYKCLINAWR